MILIHIEYEVENFSVPYHIKPLFTLFRHAQSRPKVRNTSQTQHLKRSKRWVGVGEIHNANVNGVYFMEIENNVERLREN